MYKTSICRIVTVEELPWPRKFIGDTRDAVAYYHECCAKSVFHNPDVETFWTVLLDTQLVAFYGEATTMGTVNATLVDPKQVLRPGLVAVVKGLTPKIVVFHNHPSGSPHPSPADIALTRKLHGGCELLDTELVDHIIIGDSKKTPVGRQTYPDHVSFRDSRLLP